MINIHVFNNRGELVGPVESEKLSLGDEEWRKRLTPEQFRVLRSAGTERPFCGTLLDNKQAGVYSCAGCGLPLFTSDAKFHSGTGWPSFFQPIAPGNVAEKTDYSHGMSRTEINCARCDGHLGHVFDDGPRPTGLRYCLNSESLKFTPGDQLAALADPLADSQGSADTAGAIPTGADGTPRGHETAANMATQGSGHGTQQSPPTATAVFAGGCFWCTEAAFEQLDGVIDVTSGYCGGERKAADYESVCTGRTGHAEAIRVTYDPAKISYDALLDVFFDAHDPTQLNRQGADVGTQYRSAIFYASDAERRAAESKIRQLTESHHFPAPIVTTLEALVEFFPAETYHQDYARNNPMQPYIQAAAIPKACKVREKHPGLIKKR